MVRTTLEPLIVIFMIGLCYSLPSLPIRFGRKPVQLVASPDIDDESQEVWQISQTGEVFVDYQSYLDRYLIKKQFSCEITGHMNLSFFEALISETNSSQDVDQTFPEALKDPVLRKVQFSTVSRIDTLGKMSFKSDFYPGEHVTAILPNGDRVEALVREKTMFPELRYASGDIQRKGFSRYTVKLINRNDEEAQVDNEHLVRDKKSFTKAMLRSFIKNTVSREPWNGAPWLVKEEFANRYKIPQAVPPHLQRASTAAERKAKALAQKREQGLAVASVTNSSSAPSTPVEIKPAPKSHKSKSHQAAMKVTKLMQLDREPGATSNSARTSPWSSPTGTPEAGTARVNLKAVAKEDTPPPPPPPPKPIKYPIEDLDLPYQEGPRRPKLHFLSQLPISVKIEPSAVDTIRRASRSLTRSSLVSSASPVPMNNGIDEEKVSFFLSTWVFLNIYCEPLLLDSFTFDDYLQALQFSSDEIDCDLFVEIHCALLKAIVNEQGFDWFGRRYCQGEW
ncbi:ATP-utilizing chromatin assembly and remodelling N-terminal-domain-containing protein [Tuber brumale]|nr:ATP-utilizing chromatin assembly and remodelling N-terminal-domain-containing protein [Tuber brumale]